MDLVAALATEQAGVCTTQQATAAGVDHDTVDRLLRSGRWVRLHRGVYRTAPGSVPLLARMWGAHLALGPSSVLSHTTAAQYWGLVDEPHEGPVTVLVPRHCTRVARGVRTKRVLDPKNRAHPARHPPVTTVEETVCDLVATSSSDAAVAQVVLQACRLRLTSPARLLAVADNRSRQGSRALLNRLCGDFADGATSPLEIEYRTRVGRAHRLPPGVRQAPATIGARRSYRDVAYPPFGVVVELDGRLGHELESEVLRDQFRDNALVLTGAATLRFGWLTVIAEPCTAAGQVGRLLRLRGWRGEPLPCGPACQLVGRDRRATLAC